MLAADPLDPGYRRLQYVRYADDFLIGIHGTKADGEEIKNWLEAFLRDELQLELSVEKTRITNAKERVRFLGYDIRRWNSRRILRIHTRRGVRTQRTTTYQLGLFMPVEKTIKFAQKYGDTNAWRGMHRRNLLHLSELEILMISNAEVRRFLGYYSLADNLKDGASKLLWMAQNSFFRTKAGKAAEPNQEGDHKPQERAESICHLCDKGRKRNKRVRTHLLDQTIENTEGGP